MRLRNRAAAQKKEPRSTRQLLAEIIEHPWYKARFGVWERYWVATCARGFLPRPSNCMYDEWGSLRNAREIWQFMYNGGPNPYKKCNTYFCWPAKCPRTPAAIAKAAKASLAASEAARAASLSDREQWVKGREQAILEAAKKVKQ